jgi:hypothetical protein
MTKCTRDNGAVMNIQSSVILASSRAIWPRRLTEVNPNAIGQRFEEKLRKSSPVNPLLVRNCRYDYLTAVSVNYRVPGHVLVDDARAPPCRPPLCDLPNFPYSHAKVDMTKGAWAGSSRSWNVKYPRHLNPGAFGHLSRGRTVDE